MRKVAVELGERRYDIFVGKGMLSRLGKECQRFSLAKSCVVITDENVGSFYANSAMDSLKGAGFRPLLVTLPSGETAKKLSHVERCYDAMAAHGMERKSFVVALGGGVVGDLAGFVAATFLRGVDFIQVPTTLLSLVDSSVGGKVGVNLKAGKNLVGAFHQPRSVLADLATLETLPDREYRSGLAEVIKYGIIYDAPFFSYLERRMDALLKKDLSELSKVVARSCDIKAEVVVQDEREGGLRAILNFGHTIGHALEAISKYNAYLHGEAISIGQVAAARLSGRLEGLADRDVQRITDLFIRAGLPTTLRLDSRMKARLIQAMQMDKKVADGEVKFVLCDQLGHIVTGRKVPSGLLEEVLDGLRP